jgi:hypothetical protein
LTLNQIPSHHHFEDSNPTKNLVVGGNRLETYGYSGVGATESPGIQWGKGVWPEGGSGSHYHSIGSSTQNTSSVGNDSSFSILPPYKVVYIWTRTV